MEMGKDGPESSVLLSYSKVNQVYPWQGWGWSVGDTTLLWSFGLCLPNLH